MLALPMLRQMCYHQALLWHIQAATSRHTNSKDAQ